MWKRQLFLFFLVVLACIALVPVQRETVGPLKDSVWDSSNKYVKANAKAKTIQNFSPSQYVRLEADFGHPVTKDDLLYFRARALWLEQKIRLEIGSLAKYYRVGEEVIEDRIPSEFPPDFTIEAWRRETRQNLAVYGQLVSKDFHTLCLIFFLPQEENEIPAMRKIYDVLEGVDIRPPYKALKTFWREVKFQFWKVDLFPMEEENGPKWYLSSWPSGRFAITLGFFRDTRVKSVAAYAGPFLFFLQVLFYFSVPHYLAVWIGTFLPIIFTLGSLWPLHALGIHQSVYSLPGIVAGLIVSLSFNLQKMEAFRNTSTSPLLATHPEIWEGDLLRRWHWAGLNTHPAIRLIALLTLVNFALFGWNLQSLWRAVEMDAVFLLGTAWAWVMAVFFLPSLYIFLARFFQEERELTGWRLCLCNRLDGALNWVTAKVLKENFWLLSSPKWRVVFNILPISLLGITSFLFYLGAFNTVSRPLKYLPPNLHAVRAARHANRPGGPCMDAVQVLFGMPSVPEAIRTDYFFNHVMALHKEFDALNGRCGTFSVVQEMAYQIATLPDLREPKVSNAYGVLTAGENFSNPFLASYLHTDRYVLILVFHPMERSDELEALLNGINRVLGEQTARNPKIDAFIFGEVPFFSELARLIVKQFPQAAASSLATIFAFYLFVGWRQRKRGLKISAARIGWVLAQTFIFAAGAVGLGMVIFQVPLDMATAAILPISNAAASDFNLYPALAFFLLLCLGRLTEDALREAIKEKGRAVAVDWFANSLCPSLLLASSFTPIFHIGVLSLTSLLACVGWTLFATLPLLAAGVKK